MGEKTREREDILYNELAKRQKMSLSDVEKLFHVSPSTARRICIGLTSKKKAVRTIGGIQILNPEYPAFPEYSYEHNMTLRTEEKISIGKKASSLVENGDIIFVNSGTTTFQFAYALGERIRNGEVQNIVMITNALDNAAVMPDGLDGVQTILTGGEYYSKRRDMAGIHCEQTIHSLRFNKFFTGVDSVNTQDGLMTLDMRTANIDKAASDRADTVFVLADYSKFGNNSYISYEKLDGKHVVVTDRKIDLIHHEQLLQNNISVVFSE